jgi:hypothetical protein
MDWIGLAQVVSIAVACEDSNDEPYGSTEMSNFLPS